ncbi:MAG: TlpA family protein disulfide reductase [Anaerolineae bacterium]|nr:TlpA family protein disulfide reductase [Anaerolineae bacterium]
MSTTQPTFDAYSDDPYADDALTAASSGPASMRPARLNPFSIVIILFAVLMLVVVGWGIYQNSLTQPEGGPAPEFTLPLLGQEGEFSLAEQHGKVVVINFWGSWCGPCRVEAPMLQRTWERYQDDDVVFVGIAVKDIERDALAYIDEFNITYPNVMDRRAELEKAYRTEGVPETFIVGRDGEIKKFFFAQPRETDLDAAIQAALAEGRETSFLPRLTAFLNLETR